MWIPKNEEEIKQVVASGQLQESAIFDGKRQIPKSLDLAIDIAAMATDGGVLVIGIGEDEDKRLTQLCPIPLAGAPEQVSQIIHTNIDEPPHVEVKPIQCAEDKSQGYLVVVVPQSSRAPHMVVTRGHNRFYGRTPAGNQRLTQGQVDLLYERRRRWQVDQSAVLQREIDRSPVPPRPELGYLHLVVWPTASDDRMIERMIPQLDPDGIHDIAALNGLVQRASAPEFLPRAPRTRPEFAQYGEWIRQPNGYRFAVYRSQRDEFYRETPDYVMEMQIDYDGTGHFFSGAAAAKTGEDRQTKAVHDGLVAVNAARFLALMAALYEASGYWGSVEVGLAVTGIKGAISGQLVGSLGEKRAEPYPDDDYRETRRFSRLELSDNTLNCAQHLTRRLFATTGQGRVPDPFDRLLGK